MPELKNRIGVVKLFVARMPMLKKSVATTEELLKARRLILLLYF